MAILSTIRSLPSRVRQICRMRRTPLADAFLQALANQLRVQSCVEMATVASTSRRHVIRVSYVHSSSPAEFASYSRRMISSATSSRRMNIATRYCRASSEYRSTPLKELNSIDAVSRFSRRLHDMMSHVPLDERHRRGYAIRSPKSLKIAHVTDRPTDLRFAQLKVMTDKKNNDID